MYVCVCIYIYICICIGERDAGDREWGLPRRVQSEARALLG